MKKAIYYICERCGCEYRQQAAAKKCEESHLAPTDVTASAYNGNDEYPHRIEVVFADGSERSYEFIPGQMVDVQKEIEKRGFI